MQSRDLVNISSPIERLVEPAQYEPLMSQYLHGGRQQEVWRRNWRHWYGDKLSASARLEGYTHSPTDQNRFHVSIFAAREIDAQLSIIGIHLKLGLTHKSAEVWLRKCTEVCRAPITEPADVRFDISLRLRGSRQGKVLIQQDSRISDSKGGLIQLKVQGFMPVASLQGDLRDDF